MKGGERKANFINPSEKDVVRFRKHFEEGAPTECWLWNGLLPGYRPTFRIGSREDGMRIWAAWVAYSIHYGPFTHDKTHWILHRCNEPRCVNPYHLYLGTPKENRRDAVAAGFRCKGPTPERAHKTKLTREKVKEIRAEYSRNYSYGILARLGRRYGVTSTNIQCIIRKSTWKE